tara:strand:+ start:52 stop:345 length:294 start_codon:yes stop_codon:yes gene_type:complete
MSSQFQKDLAKLLETLNKTNRVQRYLELKEALAQADGKLKELTSTVLEQNDHRFRIVEADTSERAPNAKQYIALHGQEAWEENKNIVPVKRHVRGIR